MIHHHVNDGYVSCGRSTVDGLYLLQTGCEADQTRVVMNEVELKQLIARLQGLLPERSQADAEKRAISLPEVEHQDRKSGTK
jgi:hypothetical protein